MIPPRTAAAALVLVLAAAPEPAGAAIAPGARIERADGTARSRDGGEVVYRETHWRLTGGALSRVVLYRCPDGTPFARKRLWGDPDAIAPRFEFVDGRDGYREGV